MTKKIFFILMLHGTLLSLRGMEQEPAEKAISDALHQAIEQSYIVHQFLKPELLDEMVSFLQALSQGELGIEEKEKTRTDSHHLVLIGKESYFVFSHFKDSNKRCEGPIDEICDFFNNSDISDISNLQSFCVHVDPTIIPLLKSYNAFLQDTDLLNEVPSEANAKRKLDELIAFEQKLSPIFKNQTWLKQEECNKDIALIARLEKYVKEEAKDTDPQTFWNNTIEIIKANRQKLKEAFKTKDVKELKAALAFTSPISLNQLIKYKY